MVDSPLAYYFVQKVSIIIEYDRIYIKLFAEKDYGTSLRLFKDDKFYMAIVLPLRKSSLRKMVQERHNNRDINLTVLEKLKPIVCKYNQHGDLKVS